MTDCHEARGVSSSGAAVRRCPHIVEEEIEAANLGFDAGKEGVHRGLARHIALHRNAARPSFPGSFFEGPWWRPAITTVH